MDAKEQLLVANLYQRIRTHTFHELDVLAFLILLRPHSVVGSPVRELSDFVAHREKDRGSLKTYVHRVLAYNQAVVAKKTAQVQIAAVHSAAAFRVSLNATVAKFNLAPFNSDVTDDVLACVMSLLQEVGVFHKGTEIGQLGLWRLNKELWLVAAITMPGAKKATVMFPALIVPNTYCSSGNQKLGAFSGLVEARCTKRRLRLYVGGQEVA